MEPYEIELAGAVLTIHPEGDGTYLVYDRGEKLARLYPDVTAAGAIWESADITPDLAQQIGELIEEHEM